MVRPEELISYAENLTIDYADISNYSHCSNSFVYLNLSVISRILANHNIWDAPYFPKLKNINLRLHWLTDLPWIVLAKISSSGREMFTEAFWQQSLA